MPKFPIPYKVGTQDEVLRFAGHQQRMEVVFQTMLPDQNELNEFFLGYVLKHGDVPDHTQAQRFLGEIQDELGTGPVEIEPAPIVDGQAVPRSTAQGYTDSEVASRAANGQPPPPGAPAPAAVDEEEDDTEGDTAEKVDEKSA